MKIDQDYLKNLLSICQASKKPTFDIEELMAAGIDLDDPHFEFHMKILDDQGFIVSDSGHPGFGLIKSLDGRAHDRVPPRGVGAAPLGRVELPVRLPGLAC